MKPFTGVEGEYFLTALEGCTFGCAYCYLQGHLSTLAPTFYANPVALHRELSALGRSTAGRSGRIHAAHLGEVVPFEDVTGLVAGAADGVAPFPGLTLEVRTKSDRVAGLLPLAPRSNVVFSWSLSGAGQARAFESGAPPPGARIAALASLARAGARVAVRLDPVVPVEGWEADCEALLEELRATGAAVEDFHVGVFRFPAASRGRFEATERGRSLLRGEVLAGPDGKVRLSAPARYRVLRSLASMIRARFTDRTKLVVCMEPPWLVQAVLSG